MNKPRASLTYRDAGVDIDAGDALIETIKPIAAGTHHPRMRADSGGFPAEVVIPK